jgi:hypothetical protein
MLDQIQVDTGNLLDKIDKMQRSIDELESKIDDIGRALNV